MAIAAYSSQVYLTSQPSIALTNELCTDSGDHKTYTITNQAKKRLDPKTPIVVQQSQDEVQSVTISGSPTGGTFTLSYGPNTTGAIAYNATALQVQNALTALSNVGAGNVAVTGNAGGPYTVDFTGTLSGTTSALYGPVSSLTGGASPGVMLATLITGTAYATITSGFTLSRVNARVIFAVAQPVGTHVQFASAAYFVELLLAQANNCDWSSKMAKIDTTVLNSQGVESSIPGILSGVLKTNTFWISPARSQSLIARDLLVGSFVLPSGNRYEGYVYADASNIKADPKAALGEDLSFNLTDEFFTS